MASLAAAPTGKAPRALAAADLDGDGDHEIAVAASGANAAQIFRFQ
jgi:hypothetical protein